MKNLRFLSSLILMSILFAFASCEKEADDVQPNDPLLKVVFTNDDRSEFSINFIQMISHGNAGVADEGRIGEWSGNIIPNNRTIAPGESFEVDLAIPNQYWYEYRISVIDETGNTVLLHEQAGYADDSPPRITHWGSHSRQVYCMVTRNTQTGLIYIQGWGDNAD